MFLGAAALASAATAAAPAPSAEISPATKADLRCFVLYAIAVGSAASNSDEATTEAGSIGLMYFYGKLQAEAPTLELEGAIRKEAAAMASDPKIKEVGKACDTEFAQRSAKLLELGKALESTPPQFSSAS
jgi:hypothetical protein